MKDMQSLGTFQSSALAEEPSPELIVTEEEGAFILAELGGVGGDCPVLQLLISAVIDKGVGLGCEKQPYARQVDRPPEQGTTPLLLCREGRREWQPRRPRDLL
jgi:hypothetical protein